MAKIVYGYGALALHGSVAYAEAPPLGDIHITHGYSGIASEAAFGAFYDAAGRFPGDDYSQAPYLIPLDVDVNTDPVALQALSLGISYAQALGVDPQMAAKINDMTNQLAMWAAKAVEAASRSSNGVLKQRLADWLQLTATAQDQGQRILNGGLPASRFPEWYATAQKLAGDTNDFAQALNEPGLNPIAPGGFDAMIKLLKFLVYGGVAIMGLNLAGQVVGVVKSSKRGRR